MSSFNNQIQIYQDIDLDQPNLTPKKSSASSHQKTSSPSLDNLTNDENPLVFNIEVLFVSLLLLALPIFIYLAYRYGKKMGRKEHVSDAQYYFGQNSIKRRSSQNSSSDESYHRFNSMNSKTSSTASSPALNPAISQQNPSIMKEKNGFTSFTFPKIKREFSAQTEDDMMEELHLSDENNIKLSPNNREILNKSKNDAINEIQVGSKAQTPSSDIINTKNSNDIRGKDVYRQRHSLMLPNHCLTQELSPNGSERKLTSPQIKEPWIHLNVKMDNIPLNSQEREKLEFFENDTPELRKTSKSLLALDLRRHVSLGEERRPILQGMVARGSSDVVKKKTGSLTSETREETKQDEKTKDEKRIESLVEKYELPDETGKFNKIFKDVEWIGEGSFGEVYKVVHRLDGKLYAIKKVKLKLGRFEELKKESKVFREVFAMTDLHHINIVRYSTCWVEIEWNKNGQETKEKAITKVKAPEPVDLGDISENEHSEFHSEQEEISKNSDMGFEWDISAGEKEKEKEKSRMKEKQRTQKTKESLKKKLAEKAGPGAKRKNSSLLIRTLSKSFIEEEFEEHSKNSSVSKVESLSDLSGCRLYLYIQMEYCAGQSLKYYLENTEKQITRQKALGMFRKLLEGVNAIHTRGILHRDLKPANIFLDGNENVKIGDFGLALLDKFDEQYEGMTPKEIAKKDLRKMHSLKVGTPMYTSPEQEAGGHYDQKTDIYSLGLIFYEMLVHFSTHHERYDHFNQIRNTHSLSENFIEGFPEESELILKMTSKSPKERPNVEQILHEVNKLLEKTK